MREVGTTTGCNWETVRRYLAGGRVSGRFLAAFAQAFELNAEWLLHGEGPPYRPGSHQGDEEAPAILEIKQSKAGAEVKTKG